MSFDLERRCWAEIDLDRLVGNYKLIQGASNGAKIIAVVKANAYGHGDVAVAKALESAGAEYFAVANLTEAVRLRKAGIKGSILVMGITPPEKAEVLATHAITQCVFDKEYAVALSANAVKAGVTITIHIKVDTGLARLGFNVKDDFMVAIDEIKQVCALQGLLPEGLFTHFAASAESTQAAKSYTQRQYSLFVKVKKELANQEIEFAITHCSNSGGLITRPDFVVDAVRPGIILYGLTPEDGVSIPGIKPVMELKAMVAMVKYILQGDAVSYGRTFVADHPMRVATISAGYADGYSRMLSGQGVVAVRGSKAKVLGRVCMDQFIVDVSHIPEIMAGDIVTLLGENGADTFETAAVKCNTISYELLCNIGGRVPRVYIQNGEIVSITNYMEVVI